MSSHVYFSLSPHRHFSFFPHKREGEGKNVRKLLRKRDDSQPSNAYFSLSPHSHVPYPPRKREGEGEDVRKILWVIRWVQEKERVKAGQQTGK